MDPNGHADAGAAATAPPLNKNMQETLAALRQLRARHGEARPLVPSPAFEPPPDAAPPVAADPATVSATARPILAGAAETEGRGGPEAGAAMDPDLLRLDGHLDLCNQNVLEGWIAWRHFPRVKIALEVFHGCDRIGACIADGFRGDLQAAGHGGGTCAFSFMVPFERRVVDPAELRLRVVGTPLFLMADGMTRRSNPLPGQDGPPHVAPGTIPSFSRGTGT